MTSKTKYYANSWEELDKKIKKEIDKFDKKIKIEKLCQDYHKTRAIHSACTLADLLYDVLYT